MSLQVLDLRKDLECLLEWVVCLVWKICSSLIIMNFSGKIKSLTDLLDDHVLDMLLFDSCALGSELFRHGSSLRLSIEAAAVNNINMHKVREARNLARMSIDLLQHEGTGIAPIIYEEQLQKIEMLRRVINTYGAKGWHEKRGGRGYRKHIVKESRLLRELLKAHDQLVAMISERMVDTEDAQEMESLAVEAYRQLGPNEKTKNDHDERLVGDAVYLATRFGVYVGVVTHDHRMKPILERIQMAVASGNGEVRGIREELETGKVAILRELDYKRGFQIEYCSCDFKTNGRKVPSVVKEKVEAFVS